MQCPSFLWGRSKNIFTGFHELTFPLNLPKLSLTNWLKIWKTIKKFLTMVSEYLKTFKTVNCRANFKQVQLPIPLHQLLVILFPCTIPISTSIFLLSSSPFPNFVFTPNNCYHGNSRKLVSNGIVEKAVG